MSQLHPKSAARSAYCLMFSEHRQRASTIRHPGTVSLGRRNSGELTEDTLNCLSLLAVRHQIVANTGRC